ncbi:hypothetical protein BGZ70_010688 [Mortierella alpina]|uniref:Uncharacterized protein n=1 Tax=Mortierella alpina TaxID=64518 RepID=A0A9P6LYE8_MORAP|nr:hypothetical protein BGZ70_010688 [Mortierella alpina]
MVLSKIRQHYSDTTLRRSPEKAEKDKTLGVGPLSMPYNRWLMFPAAFIFQAICGSLYAWSLIGLIYFGYGVVGGSGLGLCYISPVSALQKWFPDRRGLAAGFAVCGFGAGSIALAKVPLPLYTAIGLTNTFITLGCAYFAIMFLCCLIFRVPPPGFTVNGMDIYRNKVDSNGDIEAFNADLAHASVINPASTLSLIDSIFSREYRLIYLMFFGNSIAGLVFLSRLSNIVTNVFGRSSDTAATIVAINGGFNLGGRLFFSTASDRLGRKNAYIFMLIAQVVILAALPTIMEARNYPAFLAVIWILTACYGGGFGCIPAFLCDMFGPTNIGALHGIILTAWAIAGVGGGLLFTAIYNNLIANGYTAASVWVYAKNLYWILAVACLGFLFVLFVRTSIRDRLLPAAPGEFTRVRFFGHLIRVGSSGVKVLTKDEEDAEWSAYVNSRASPDTLQEVEPSREKYVGQKSEYEETPAGQKTEYEETR